MNRLLPILDLGLSGPSFPYDFEFIPIVHPLPIVKEKLTKKIKYSTSEKEVSPKKDRKRKPKK